MQVGCCATARDPLLLRQRRGDSPPCILLALTSRPDADT